jgi:DNA transformation protein and related proteins
MAVSKEYVDYLLEVLEPMGTVRSNRMFGGAGIYLDEIFIAIVVEDEVFFKADDQSRPLFEAEGLEPFSYVKKDGIIGVMSYYAAPEGAIDDPRVMREWAKEGLGAALRASKNKKSKKKPNKNSG